MGSLTWIEVAVRTRRERFRSAAGAVDGPRLVVVLDPVAARRRVQPCSWMRTKVHCRPAKRGPARAAPAAPELRLLRSLAPRRGAAIPRAQAGSASGAARRRGVMAGPRRPRAAGPARARSWGRFRARRAPACFASAAVAELQVGSRPRSQCARRLVGGPGRSAARNSRAAVVGVTGCAARAGRAALVRRRVERVERDDAR